MPSNVIAGMEYIIETATLRITFVSGSIYEYEGVPEPVFQAMKTSGSKGVYLNTHIKPNFPYKKIR